MSETTTRTIVEEVANAVRYSDGTILLKNVRCSYPHILTPQENKDDSGNSTYSYSIVGLMPKATHDEAKKMCVRAINAILKESNKGEKIPSNKKFLRDGDPKDDDDVGKPEEAGMWVVSTRESKRPIALSNKKDPETGKLRRLKATNPGDSDVIFGGCWVNILIRPWFQNNKYGKRVNAGLSVVQFRKKDEPFGTGRIREEDIDDTFGEEADGEEGDEGDEDDTEGL